jgi:hypothetical protein
LNTGDSTKSKSEEDQELVTIYSSHIMKNSRNADNPSLDYFEYKGKDYEVKIPIDNATAVKIEKENGNTKEFIKNRLLDK